MMYQYVKSWMTFVIYAAQQSSTQFGLKRTTASPGGFQATFTATLRSPSAAHRTALGTCFGTYAQGALKIQITC